MGTPEVKEAPKAEQALREMDAAFKADKGPDSVTETNEKLEAADFYVKSFGFPLKTPTTAEDRADIKQAKDAMSKPPAHYQAYEIENANGEINAVVIYDATNKSYNLCKTKLSSEQVEAKWNEVMKGKEISPNLLVPGCDEMKYEPEGTVKTVKEGGKSYVMARLRGGRSERGIRMSEEKA